MKRLAFLFSVFIALASQAQDNSKGTKLIVGIVVDQMRADYLHRYAEHFSEKGFKRMMNHGFYAANHHFSYMPTTTGPGHASVYTGTTPAIHSIVANNWYDKNTKESMYCVQDKSVRTVGADNDKGQMSPRNLKVTTITDELMLFWNFRSKVIGVSIKDRGAVLPAGHLANAAYWLNKTEFISSSYYMEELPSWVSEFNNESRVDDYIKEGWQPYKPLSEYYASSADDNHYETVWPGEEKPVLPKDLKAIAKENGKKRILTHTPHGNSYLTDFAKAAILNEDLGKDDATDFLAISYSGPDYIGHAYGPRAVEIEDTYLKLDLEIAGLIDFLNEEVGFDAYTIFLTADHGVADVPQFSVDHNLPGGYIDTEGSIARLDSVLKEFHPAGIDLIEKIEGNNLFFDYSALKEADIELDDIAEYLALELNKFEHIYEAFPSTVLAWESNDSDFPQKQLSRGVHPSLSGDVVWLINSGWLDYSNVGTSHGTGWNYDTHIPLLFYGNGVNKGKTYRETNIRDIACTISMMFNLPIPSGSTGTPIFEVLHK